MNSEPGALFVIVNKHVDEAVAFDLPAEIAVALVERWGRVTTLRSDRTR